MLTCEQDGCTGHLGKFGDCQTEALWQISLDGGDESTGTSEFEGYVTLIVVPVDGWHEKIMGDDKIDVLIPEGAYLTTDTNSGAVYSERYDTEREAREVFAGYEARYAEWDDEEV